MVEFPRLESTFDDLPKNLDERREALLDILGQHVCWTRDLAIARLTTRAACSKDEPENGHRLVYEEIAKLSTEGRELAFKLASVAIDVYTKLLLALLGNIGTDLKQDENHVIWYKLVAEIYDIQLGAIVEECVLNRDQLQFLPDYLSQWLQRQLARNRKGDAGGTGKRG